MKGFAVLDVNISYASRHQLQGKSECSDITHVETLRFISMELLGSEIGP
jgi:hypothetical protein